MGLSTPWDESYPNNCFEPPNCHHCWWCFRRNGSSTTKKSLEINQQENPETIYLKPVNKPIMKNVTTKLAHLPRDSTRMQGKKIWMSNIYMAYRKFTIKTEDKF